MIKRIVQIKNVGKFKDSLNAAIEFGNFTFIYALNTRGKTTLSDIFYSYQKNESSLITNRKSIPEEDDSSQLVNFTIEPINNSGERSCSFSNDNWNNKDFNKNLHVFGSSFIHRNLFTGLSIERKNKENLTQFILGEEGVGLAEKIGGLKKELRERRKNLPGFLPPFLKDKDDDEKKSFFEIDIEELNIESLKEDLNGTERELKKEKERLDKPQKIQQLPDLKLLRLPQPIIRELTDDTNNLLKSNFDEIDEQTMKDVDSHIHHHFQKTENAENWIKEGLDWRKEDSTGCPFCGQSLEGVEELMKAYRSYFNEKYKEFIGETNNRIQSIQKKWEDLDFRLGSKIQNHLNTIKSYKDYITDDAYKRIYEDFEELSNSLKEEELNQSKLQLLEEIKEKFEEKTLKPYDKVSPIDFLEFIRDFEDYCDKLKALWYLNSRAVVRIKWFKEKYSNTDAIRERIKALEDQIIELRRLIARIEQDEDCTKYKKERKGIQGLGKEIEEKHKELRKNQEDFLDRYFQKINEYFKRLGSRDFELKKSSNRRGDVPVYSLKVLFKDVEITDSNIGKVFSESDRRALALAVFWAKISLLEEDEKKNAIVILDDPITSFDDNRILNSLNLFKDTLNEVRQIIILTHYNHFIKSFMERSMNDDFSPKFIEIVENSNGSEFKEIDGEVFILSPYEVKFNKIKAFIDRESEEDIRNDLRPFLESQYLPKFFIDKLKEARNNGESCGKLSEKIDAIFPEGKVRDKFHKFRETLNTDSHLFTSNNEEDIRNFATEMMDFLYGFEYVNQK